MVDDSVDVTSYERFFYVNEALAGAKSEFLFLDDPRSLMILGHSFVNHDAAQSLCSDLKAQNIDCFVVGG